MAQIAFEDESWRKCDLLGDAAAQPAQCGVRFQVVGGRGILDYENFEFLRLGAGDASRNRQRGWSRTWESCGSSLVVSRKGGLPL